MPDAGRPFTALGEPDLERRIEADLTTISAAVQAAVGPRLHALVLGGGYGRGEGGGQLRGGGWCPFNDYDLFVVLEGVSRWAARRWRERLAALGRELEPRVGLEVEIAPLRREELPRLPFTMMWCELRAGYRVLLGPPAVLATAAHLPPERLPRVEGTQYLANRAALLLWSLRERLPAERVWKWIHKSWLAVGAAVLISNGRFCVGYGARQAAIGERVGDLPVDLDPRLVRDRHREAAAARLRPDLPPAEPVVAERLAEARQALLATWRWCEARRLGRPLLDWNDYLTVRPLLAQRPAVKGIAQHLRLSRRVGLRPLRALAEPPRARVLRALPWLLATRSTHPDVAALVGGGDTWEEQASRCLELWRCT